MTTDAPSFAQRLRRLRTAAGLTQAELAERAGLSVKAVSALERGNRQRPYPSTVRALAAALGLSEEERAELAGATHEPSRNTAQPAVDPPLLPEPPTPIVGREAELAELNALFGADTTRLITLTGPGGVGKTRLALEIAHRLASPSAHHAAFVPLSPVAEPELVMATLAGALGVPESSDARPAALVAAHIGRQPWLLVLDNLEHLLAAGSDLAELLAACPQLKILATSRAPLRVRAEREYPLRPLALPDLDRIPALADVAGSSSVQLFLARAQAAVPAFELTQANCAAVAAICRRLDGLPLALELVAARVRAMNPTELLARLDRVLPLLVGGSRDLPQRQQTMQAAINWSYELLSPIEQAFFRRLSVFAGGWNLEAAEAITVWNEIDGAEVLELLYSLVEQSLVVVDTDPQGATRFRMLETIRQYAQQRVEESGELDRLARNHFTWCLGMAHAGEHQFQGPDQQAWLNLLEREHDNVRAALTWCQSDRERKAQELELAGSLWLFWETRGHLTEGRRWLAQALTDSEAAPAEYRANAFNAAGNLARDQGDSTQAVRFHEASLGLRRQLGDRHAMAQSYLNVGNVNLDQGRYTRACEYYVEALALFRETGSDWDVANALNNMGISLGNRGEYEQAADLLEEALVLRQKIGDLAYRARTLDALGVVLQRQGELARAEALHVESLALRRELGEARGTAIALKNLGQVARYRGDFSAAIALIEESLHLREAIEDRLGIAISLGALADVMRQQGNPKRALSLYMSALRLQKELGIDDGVADNLLGVADIALKLDQPEQAARLFGASEILRERLEQIVAPVDLDDHRRIATAIEDALGEESFERACAEGTKLTTEEAIECALLTTPADAKLA